MARASSARSFAQVDVFGAEPLRGNPVAVVLDAAGLDAARMQRFADWTNLSETTFVTAPAHPRADYAVRIFTGERELPFAGHPTLGTAHAWLAAGGRPRGEVIHQECGAGLIAIRHDPAGRRLSLAAPAARRSGPLDEADLDVLVRGLGLAGADILEHSWCDNGPPWQTLLLDSAARVLSVDPDPALLAGRFVGLVGAHEPGADARFEVRAFFPAAHGIGEDPVTGSLNAAVAQWLMAAGHAPEHYRVAQGTRLGRAGRVDIDLVDGTIWVGGACTTVMSGTVDL